MQVHLSCARAARCLSVRLWLVLALAGLTFPHQHLHAQETARKVKRSVQPEYPEIAKRINLRGSVRVRVLIAPDGKVKEAKVLGGNPVLAQAAVEAVEKWLFEPEPQASSMIVKFDFSP